MKKELFELAEEKGFESKITRVYCIQGVIEELGEELFYYLWMCELQKSVRGKYKIIVDIANNDLDWSYQIYDISCFNEDFNRPLLKNGTAGHKEHEEAFELGLIEALKLI